MTRTGFQTHDVRGLRFVHLLPIGVFGLLALAFAIGLTLNPRELPSTLIGKAVPAFDLPPVPGMEAGTKGLADTDLKGSVSLVNVWASWCTECKEEHPFLMELEAAGIVPIRGLNYKDRAVDAAAWLRDLGNPYDRVGADRDGRVSIDWGVYGVPETFLVNGAGEVVYKHIGALDWPTFKAKILPLIDELRAAPDA